MPQTAAPFLIKSLGTAIAGALGFAATGGAALAIGGAAIALSTVAVRRGTRDLQIPEARVSGREQSVRSTEAPRVLVYGETVVGGVIAYGNSYGAELRAQVIEVIHTCREIEGYVGWFIDDRYIPVADVDDIIPVNLTDGTYQWTLSGSGTSEYYLELSGGGDPGISEPTEIQENGSAMTEATFGSLAAGEWDWGDNDTLGYSTVYVRLTDSVDPDTKASGFLWRLGNGEVDSDTNSHNLGPVDTTPIVFLRGWLGPEDQAADNFLVDVFADIDEDHRHRGCARTVFRADVIAGSEDRWAGLVPQNLRAVIKGHKVYDPRLDSTFSGDWGTGSGAHRTNDSSTWEYSQNPALIWADYRISGMRFGDSNAFAWAAAQIDYNSVAEAADDCEVSASIPGPATEDRFRCNIAVDSSMDHTEIERRILSTMGGTRRYFNGQWHVYASTFPATDFTLDDDDLVGPLEFRKQPQTQRGDRYNIVRGTYIDPARNYLRSPFLEVEDSTLKTNRDGGEEIPTDLRLEATMTETQAQRLGFRHLNQADDTGVCVFPMGFGGLDIRVGDTGQVTIDELSWASKVFRCLGHEYESFDRVGLILKEDASGNYTDPGSGDYGTRTAAGTITWPRVRRDVVGGGVSGDTVVGDPYFTRAQAFITQSSSFDATAFWKWLDNGGNHTVSWVAGQVGAAARVSISTDTSGGGIWGNPIGEPMFFDGESFRINLAMRRISGSPTSGSAFIGATLFNPDKITGEDLTPSTLAASTIAGWTANNWQWLEYSVTASAASPTSGRVYIVPYIFFGSISQAFDAATVVEIDQFNLTRN